MHIFAKNRVATQPGKPGKPGKSLTLMENLEKSGNLYIFVNFFDKELQFCFCSGCVGIDFNFYETL